MDITLSPRYLQGTLPIIPSKSMAHRYLICSAFAVEPTELICPDTNDDIEATADCLTALGAGVSRIPTGYRVTPISHVPCNAVLRCRESGSTLRFLLPVAGALGVDATFVMDGRLPQRPLSPLWEEMERMGCRLTRPTDNTIRCTGKLLNGEYRIDGGVSSQYISGLLFAASILGNSHVTISGHLESGPYVTMTRQALALFENTHDQVVVEGDWSNGAFWLAATALGNDISVTGLMPDSPQGDRAAAELLSALKDYLTISAADIPDLVPILSVVAAFNQGAQFTNIRRLRLKESDRVASTISMIEQLGGKAEANENTLRIYGTGLKGGIVDACNDHRIAMSAAIAATVCTEPVTILGAECVKKSYPGFWKEYTKLGGVYEQYLR